MNRAISCQRSAISAAGARIPSRTGFRGIPLPRPFAGRDSRGPACEKGFSHERISAISAIGLAILLTAGCNQPIQPPAATQDLLKVQVAETFRLSDADSWLFRTPQLWTIAGQAGRRYLQMQQPAGWSTLPGAARPQEYAIYKPYEFRSFALSCFVRVDGDLNASGGGPCVIFGRRDNTHYYSVSLSGASKDGRNTITLADGATRRQLTPGNHDIKPVFTDHDWHKVDVLRNFDSGLIQVFLDARDEKTAKPYLQVTDKTCEWGFLGLGSGDEAASFAHILIDSAQARKPAQPPMPEGAAVPAASN